MHHSEVKELVLIPTENPRRPGKAMAYLDGALCLFEDKLPTPKFGVGTQCMITGVFHPLMPDDSVYRDHSKVSFLFVREVQADDVLVKHDGFECAGSMCQTLSSAHCGGKRRLLSPGRTEIYAADNVSVAFRGGFKEPMFSGYVYVKQDRIDRTNGVIRIEGLVDINHLEWKVRPQVNAQYEAFKERKAA